MTLIRRILAYLALAAAIAAPSAGIAANISGDVRGVSLFHLDGVAQDFPYILNNLSNVNVRAKLDNLLAKYRAAGVNWIRIVVAHNHFPAGDVHPVPSQALIDKVNAFMAITRAGPNAGRFTIELVLMPHVYPDKNPDGTPNPLAGQFSDGSIGYTRDKEWFRTWLTKLNYTNLGMVMFGGDLSPCVLNGCENTPLTANHGAWIKAMWAWKNSNYPTLNASYEVIAVENGFASNNDPALIKSLATWSATHTPSNPVLAASLYIVLQTGSSWQAYKLATEKVLEAYHSLPSTANKPLWIDEFGKEIGMYEYGTHVWTEADQQAAYAGFLGASVCSYQKRYAKFAWSAGNDWPYRRGNNGTGDPFYFGLATFPVGSNVPTMRPAWNDLSLYYNLQACP